MNEESSPNCLEYVIVLAMIVFSTVAMLFKKVTK
jgi:hypothetical protein